MRRRQRSGRHQNIGRLVLVTFLLLGENSEGSRVDWVIAVMVGQVDARVWSCPALMYGPARGCNCYRYSVNAADDR